MSDPTKYLIQGPMPQLNKMSKKDLMEEAQMWRNIWGWVPSEVKYYITRMGQTIGLTLRNYKRYLGVLVDSHWELKELEIGTTDKVYDPVDDQTYFEKKIVRINISGLLDMEWIKERKSWESFESEATGVTPEKQKIEQREQQKIPIETVEEPKPETEE